MTVATSLMARRARRVALALVVVAMVVAGLAVADRLLSRPDRRHFAQQVNDLVSVRDAILRFQYDWGYLPQRLEEVTPGYLRPDQLVTGDGQPRYAYDREARTIALARPVAVHGLIARPQLAGFDLPLTPADTPPPPPAGNVLTVPTGPPGLRAPPAGAYVFEAEDYSELNYGWEAHPDPDCGGGAYFHSKEGIGNGPGQWGNGIFDFYNIHEGNEFFRLVYRLHLPVTGRYRIFGRFFTTGTHCSNCLIIGIDEGGPDGRHGEYHGHRLRNEEPFQWVWTELEDGPFTISAGDHFLDLFLHEDGMRLDQVMLSPVEPEGSGPYQANLTVNAGTAFEAAPGPPADLTFDLASMVMTPGMPPRASVTIRSLRPAKGPARLEVNLLHAGPDGADVALTRLPLALDGLPPLAFVAIDFSPLDLAGMPRREYLLQARLLQGDTVLAETHTPLMKPFEWETSRMLPYLTIDQPGPLDRETPGEAGDWTPLADSSWDHLGVMDFGLQTIGNSLHAPENVTIYARTVIHVPADGTYLVKLQSDDQMLLWFDGRLVYTHERQAPVTRSAAWLPMRLTAGDHRVRMRVNQRLFSSFGDGRWQASLRFRTRDDALSNVTGVE